MKDKGPEVETDTLATLEEHREYLKSKVYADHKESLAERLQQARDLLETQTDYPDLLRLQGRIHELKVMQDWPERFVMSLEYDYSKPVEDDNARAE